VDEPYAAVKRRYTPLEAAETAIGCRGKEEKNMFIVSILLLIDTVRGWCQSNLPQFYLSGLNY